MSKVVRELNGKTLNSLDSASFKTICLHCQSDNTKVVVVENSCPNDNEYSVELRIECLQCNHKKTYDFF